MKVEERAEREIEVPHRGSTLTFVYPPEKGRDNENYQEVINSLSEKGLRMPTMSEAVSFLHQIYESDQELYQEIREDLHYGGFLTSTGNRYIPEKGAYIQDDAIKDGKPKVDDEKSLEERLKSGDPKVRFVPFDFLVGVQPERHWINEENVWSLRDPYDNPYFVELLGNEESGKLTIVNRRFCYGKDVKGPVRVRGNLFLNVKDDLKEETVAYSEIRDTGYIFTGLGVNSLRDTSKESKWWRENDFTVGVRD